MPLPRFLTDSQINEEYGMWMLGGRCPTPAEDAGFGQGYEEWLDENEGLREVD